MHCTTEKTMNTTRSIPLNGEQKQRLAARKDALKTLNHRIEELAKLKSAQKRAGRPVTKNLNVIIKFMRALHQEVVDGQYDIASITVYLKEPIFVLPDGCTAEQPNPAP